VHVSTVLLIALFSRFGYYFNKNYSNFRVPELDTYWRLALWRELL